MFVSDVLRDNCLKHVPFIGDIDDKRVGTQGGGVLKIRGKFHGVEEERLTFIIENSPLQLKSFQNEEISVILPALAHGEVLLFAHFDGKPIKTFSIKASNKMDSVLTESQADFGDAGYSVTLTGVFIGEITEVIIAKTTCRVKSANQSVLRCKLNDLPAGRYVPTILTTHGYSVYGNDKAKGQDFKSVSKINIVANSTDRTN